MVWWLVLEGIQYQRPLIEEMDGGWNTVDSPDDTVGTFQRTDFFVRYLDLDKFSILGDRPANLWLDVRPNDEGLTVLGRDFIYRVIPTWVGFMMTSIGCRLSARSCKVDTFVGPTDKEEGNNENTAKDDGGAKHS